MEPLNSGAKRSAMASAWWQASIFGAYFAQFVKNRLAYRADFIIETLAVFLSMAIQLTVLTTLFSKVDALRGWSYEQVLFIYGFSLVPLGIFNLTSLNLYQFSSRYIIDGKFDRVLLRPVDSLAQVMFESFNVSGLNEIILGSVVMFYAGAKLGLTMGVSEVLAFLVLAPAASLVYTGVFLGVTSVSFWFEDRMGLGPPIYNVIRFSRYPLTIFSWPVRLFLTFVLPFAWVAFYPATWFVGGEGFHEFSLFTILVGFVVAGGAVLIWRRGVKNYTSTGS